MEADWDAVLSHRVVELRLVPVRLHVDIDALRCDRRHRQPSFNRLRVYSAVAKDYRLFD